MKNWEQLNIRADIIKQDGIKYEEEYNSIQK